MKLCRFSFEDKSRIGLIQDDQVFDLTAAGIPSLTAVFESADPAGCVRQAQQNHPPSRAVSSVRLLSPVERQEVWAAGVTYLRSKKARMEESDFSASAYDRVYEAERPEIFFKSLPEKVVTSGETVGIRRDARWNVPEPELALILNSRGSLAGFAVGNDMSSRDIEGENVLYLPQAKIYRHSCGLGPVIRIAAAEEEARTWKIQIRIRRGSETVFEGETSVSQIKRSFTELAGFLFRSQVFSHGAILLTGTGIVPPDSFTLHAQDHVRIEISGIGLLENAVAEV